MKDMRHVPHELAAKILEHKEKIHVVKMNDTHPAHLCNVYCGMSKEAHQEETLIRPGSLLFDEPL